jgi:hypothetical protein
MKKATFQIRLLFMPPHQFKKKKIMVYVSGHAIPKGLKL